MNRLTLEVGFKTDVGRQRERNEDSFAIYVPYPGDDNPSGLAGLLLVADGMGGERAGDRASQLAAERLRLWLTSGGHKDWPEQAEGLEAVLRRAVSDVSDEIYGLGEADPSIRGLGSTLVLAAFPEGTGTVIVVNVGDSRCYRVRGSVIERLSVDHSWVGRQVEAGVLSADEARRHPQRNVLTRSLGDAVAPEAAVRCEPIADGDLFVLCTDGLTGGLSDADILAAVAAHPGAQPLAEALVAAANERDGSDNVTVVVGRCHGEDEDTVELPPISGELHRRGDTPTVPVKLRLAAETPTLPDATVGAGPPRPRRLGWLLLGLALGLAIGALAPRLVAGHFLGQAEAFRVAGKAADARDRGTELLRLVFGPDQASRLLDMLAGRRRTGSDPPPPASPPPAVPVSEDGSSPAVSPAPPGSSPAGDASTPPAADPVPPPPGGP